MDFLQYTGPGIRCNGYLIPTPQGYIAVDAPTGFADWVQRKLKNGARVTDLLITHQHFDHVEDAAALQNATGCTIHACMPYSKELTLELLVGDAWGLPPIAPYHVDDAFGSCKREADWGGLEWKVYPIPGHAKDGVAYGLPAEGLLFVGDILFAGAVGRTDLPGGSMRSLVTGIREFLLPLPPHTRVLCGHGPETSIGEESLNNGYL